MNITITPKQFIALKQELAKQGEREGREQISEEARIEVMHTAAHLEALNSIIGKEAVDNALLTGETLCILVDWSE